MHARSDGLTVKTFFIIADDPESSSSPNRRLKQEDDDELQGGIHVPAVDLSLAAAAGAAVGSSSPGTNNTRGSVSTRDMGTEMTPIASVEPSRTATPLRATTPNLGSPINSRPSTPDRASIVLSSTPTSTNNNNNNNSCASRRSHGAGAMGGKTTTTSKQQECSSDGMQSTSSSSNKLPLSGKELQAKTRQEILALGTQLGKPNIAAWATKEEEEADAAKALKASVELEEVRKNLLASRAAAWEEAEQAKYAARFKREEAKIQAWENHEKAKAEAEMRRIEVTTTIPTSSSSSSQPIPHLLRFLLHNPFSIFFFFCFTTHSPSSSSSSQPISHLLLLLLHNPFPIFFFFTTHFPSSSSSSSCVFFSWASSLVTTIGGSKVNNVQIIDYLKSNYVVNYVIVVGEALNTPQIGIVAYL